MSTDLKKPEFLRLIFTDLMGYTRSIEVGMNRLEEVVKHGMVIDGSSVPGYALVNKSDLLLLPESATPTPQPWDPSAAYIICGVHETSRKPHPRDPRHILRRVVTKAAEMGFQMMAGSELEFFTVDKRPDGSVVPLDYGGYFSSQPMDGSLELRRDVIRALNSIQIPTTSHHHEAANGQHEIGLNYRSASLAADDIMIARTAISEIAYRRGQIATFMPKPFTDQNGSGMHIHQSIWGLDGSRNLFASKTIGNVSPLAMYYVGGLLEHATTLAAVLAPTVNSYKRLVPGFEAPTRVAWGYRNRTTMVRVPHFNGSAKAARVELRCPDATSSPHLVIAVMLAAGLDGITKRTEPPNPTEEDLFETSTDTESLPPSLDRALISLEHSRTMRDILGESVVDTLVTMRRKEWTDYVTATGDPGTSEITPWEIDRYLHVN
ncbi:MAG: glutamine synthetase family protein [Candidatus Thorarchaeota archaeon]